jgi:hypothetical protein
MADVKISGLPASSVPLAGTEVLPIVQGGQTRQVSVNNLTTGKAVSATQYTSTIVTGTAPLVVASTTEVANLRSANATSADTANQVKSNATTGVLQVTGPATAATRVMTTPDANFTAARTDAAQTFTGIQTFSANAIINNTANIGWRVGARSDNVISAIYSTSVTPNSTNYALQASSSVTYVNNPTSTSLSVADNAIATATTAGLTLPGGNLIIGTSGKGIDFSATPGTGTSELLADYEEGTWTPTSIVGSASANTATYTKIGRVVYFSGTITFPTQTNAAQVQMGGFPFATGSNTFGQTGGLYADYTNISTVTMAQLDSNGATQCTFFNWGGAGPTYTDFSGKRLDFVGFYRAA